MSTIARITGPLPPSAYVPKLRTAVAQHSTTLDRVRTNRAQQQAAQDLRNEQNSAYERSLAQDRERTRLRREAEAAELLSLQEALEKRESEEKSRQMLEQWKIWRAQRIVAAPEPDVKDVTRISIRMTSGERVVRKFASAATIEDLYAFVECYEVLQSEKHTEPVTEPRDYKHEYGFRLVSPMPRVVYDVVSKGTVGDRLGRNGTLIVESISLEEEEDEE